jgi:isopentenyl diphosphate isomerase/L-lactate dehydrogenase-like FMN-dependent dehydrogenase
VLPIIRAAVGKDFEVYVDGGVRTGNDILKSIALGANYVFIGRPISYSLTFGYDGVKKMVEILADELRRGMILTGCK